MKDITEKVKIVLLARLKTTWIVATTRTRDIRGTNNLKIEQLKRAIEQYEIPKLICRVSKYFYHLWSMASCKRSHLSSNETK